MRFTCAAKPHAPNPRPIEREALQRWEAHRRPPLRFTDGHHLHCTASPDFIYSDELILYFFHPR